VLLPDWLAQPLAAKINYIPPPAAVNPFYRQWRYDLVPVPDWLGTSHGNTIIRLLTEGGQPHTKQWHYDYVSTPDWLGTPLSAKANYIPQVFIFPTSKTKQWRYDYDVYAQGLWLGSPLSSLTINLPKPVPTKDLHDHPFWTTFGKLSSR